VPALTTARFWAVMRDMRMVRTMVSKQAAEHRLPDLLSFYLVYRTSMQTN